MSATTRESVAVTRICPISVLIPTKNESRNLGRCLDALQGWAEEIVIVDSSSTDGTAELARSYGATVLTFRYGGGWPKKRQWALDTHPWRHEWVLLLDADEILNDDVKQEIATAIQSGQHDGYWLRFCIVFLGRMLRHGDTDLWKLCLFRPAKGAFEKRLSDQDASMCDMEVHEHVYVNGSVGKITAPVRHENVNSLDRYIEKHNAYSNWEAAVWLSGMKSEIKPRLFGTQRERRRWLKPKLLMLPCSPLLIFLYRYVFRGGLFDGRPGLIHAIFKAIQFFHAKAKIYEASLTVSKSQQQSSTSVEASRAA